MPNREEKNRLYITKTMISNVYRELEGTTSYGWWMHSFFDEAPCRFGAMNGKNWIDFPTEDMKIMFLLKYGAA